MKLIKWIMIKFPEILIVLGILAFAGSILYGCFRIDTIFGLIMSGAASVGAGLLLMDVKRDVIKDLTKKN